MAQVEGGQWIVSLAGAGDHAPGRDETRFRDFADQLADPIVSRLLDSSVPSSAISVFGGTVNRRRHFERLSQPPRGYVALGDAFCAFNPTYGQGITMAVLYAEILDRLLAERAEPAQLPAACYRAFAAAADPAWSMAIRTDLAYPTTTGPGLPSSRLARAYTPALHRAAGRNSAVRRELLLVTHMLKPPSALKAPGILLRTALHGTQRQHASSSAPSRSGAACPVDTPLTGSPRITPRCIPEEEAQWTRSG